MISHVVFVCFAVLYGSVKAVEVHQPQPYSFGYTIKDKEGVQHRQEDGDGVGNVKGNYGFYDNKGIRRQVDYVADHGGFRAQIKTNEPGTTGRQPASVKMLSNDPYAHGAGIPYNSKVNVPYVASRYESSGVIGLPTVRDFHAYPIDHLDAASAGNDQPGMVYYAGNLIGGDITGHDSRFSNM